MLYMASRRLHRALLQMLLLACSPHAAGTVVLHSMARRGTHDDRGGRASPTSGSAVVAPCSGHANLVTRRPLLSPRAPVTRALLYANCAAFLLTARRPGLMQMLAKDDRLLRLGQYHRLFSACVLHASVPHLVVNSASLNQLGPSIERWFGSDRMLGVYVASGVAGNALSFAVGRSPVSVGASGAIFGLLGAWAVFLALNERGYFAARGVDVSGSLGAVVQTCALNAALGLSPGSNIDNMGHIGGLLGGAATAYAFGPRLRLDALGRVRDEPLVRLPRGPIARRRRRRSSGRGQKRRRGALVAAT